MVCLEQWWQLSLQIPLARVICTDWRMDVCWGSNTFSVSSTCHFFSADILGTVCSSFSNWPFVGKGSSVCDGIIPCCITTQQDKEKLGIATLCYLESGAVCLGLEGAAVRPRDCMSRSYSEAAVAPGGGFWPPQSSSEENLCSSCFEQRKEHFTTAWWSLRIQICYPLDLRITETCVKHFSSVWPVCRRKPHLLPQLLVIWQDPSCAFSAQQLSFSKTGWSSAAGLEPGPAAGAVNGWLKPLI